MADDLPKTTRSSSELEPSLFAPCTETHAASPMDINPSTIVSFFASLVITSPKILVAGCGTGQHSIETAYRFSGCKVTAVDLSLSSLAYAKRKTSEMKLNNIDYIQADILNLALLGKKFDIIESVAGFVS